LKSQIAVDKKTQKIICTAYTNGKRHDFRFLKESKIRFQSDIMVMTDTGYIGLQKIHAKTSMPKKRSKKNPLSAEDKRKNKNLSAQRVLNEHVIGKIKRFKIVADKYRNRRKRFGLRFNLIAGIYNYELL
jgi:hypothetical protein